MVVGSGGGELAEHCVRRRGRAAQALLLGRVMVELRPLGLWVMEARLGWLLRLERRCPAAPGGLR